MNDCSGNKNLVFHITPSTGDQEHEKYVALDLHILLSKEVSLTCSRLLIMRGHHLQYPETPAVIRTGRSRGISDARLKE